MIECAVMLLLVFIASCCQVALKKAAMHSYSNTLAYYFNCTTVGAYTVFLLTTIGSVWCLKRLPLGTAGCLESSAYLYIMLLDRFFFNRRITWRKLLGNALVILGITFCIIP